MYAYDDTGFHLLVPDRLQNLHPGSLASRGDTLWVGTSDGLYRYTDSTLTSVRLPHEEAAPVVTTLATAPNGRLWVETERGLFRYDGSRFERLPGTTDLEVLSVLDLPQHAPWIGTRNGLFRWQGGQLRSTSVDSIAVRDIFLDREQNVWIATDGNGLFKYTYTPFDQFTTADGLASNQARSLAVDENGQVWAGKGASRFDGQRFHPTPAVVNANLGAMGSLTIDADGYLWMGTQRGMFAHPSPQENRPDSLITITPEDGLTDPCIGR